jgi:hypothetical protein
MPRASSRVASDGLVHCVRRREGVVVHAVPVADVVLDVEADEAQSSGEGHRAGELLHRGATRRRIHQRVGDVVGLVGEQRPADRAPSSSSGIPGPGVSVVREAVSSMIGMRSTGSRHSLTSS